MRRFILAIAALLLLIPSFAGAAAASSANQYGYAPLNVSLDGPTLVANASTTLYYLNLSGGPSGYESYNYSYVATVHASNATGSGISPSSGKSATGVFPINITALSSSGVMTVVVNATYVAGSITVNKSQSFLITVVYPIRVVIPIINNGDVGARNIPVSMYVDGKFIKTYDVNVPAHSETNVTFDWIAYTYSPGTHYITLVIDSNGTLLFLNGAHQTTVSLYIPSDTYTLLDNIMISGIILASVAFLLIYMRRPKPRA